MRGNLFWGRRKFQDLMDYRRLYLDLGIDYFLNINNNDLGRVINFVVYYNLLKKTANS